MVDDETSSGAIPSLKVGFLGAGMMATAIMDGLIAKQVVAGPTSISCSDVWHVAREQAAAKGYFASDSNTEVCQRCCSGGESNSDASASSSSSTTLCALVIAVKPHAVAAVCADIRQVPATKQATIISVAAGVTLETLEHALPGRRVVRIMPNTACTVGQSASGYALGALCEGGPSGADKQVVERIFGAVGLAHELPEFLLNAVTGLSGSGPAYVFAFIEAMADGGVRAGLPRAEALQLAAQTVKGAADMVLQTGLHPGELKDRVCSPGGTTIAGMDQLEQGGMRSAVINAVKAATRRSMQLGGTSEQDIVNKYNL